MRPPFLFDLLRRGVELHEVEWRCDAHRLTTQGNPCCTAARVVAWVEQDQIGDAGAHGATSGEVGHA